MPMTREKEKAMREEFEANLDGKIGEWLQSGATQEQLNAQEEGLRDEVEEELRNEFEEDIEDMIDRRLEATREDREEKAAEEYEERLREEFEERLGELRKEDAA